MKTFVKLASVAAIVGVFAGSMFLWIGFQHNPQGEFMDIVTGEIHLQQCLILFGSWFLIGFILSGFMLAFGWAIAALLHIR